MAYDQNAAYQPPTRTYMRQPPPQQSNPGYNNYDEYQNQSYDQYDQGYAQDYRGHQHEGYDYGYQQGNGAHEQAYDDGYGADYGRQQGNGQQQYQQREERAYDPRYQQRQPRGPPQQPQPRPHPSQRGPPPQGRPPPGDRRARGPPMQNGQPPMQGHGYPRGREDEYASQSQRPRDAYDQQNGRSPERPRTNGNAQSRSRQPAEHSSKSSMEEWKAREKAKMKQDALSPKEMPFDNAFPVFGKKKDPRASNRSGEGGQRGSLEQNPPRPHTSADPRPAMTQENGARSRQDMQQHATRPDMDRQYTSPEFASGRQNGGPPPQNRPRNAPEYGGNGIQTPVREDYPDQWPMGAGQAPAQTQRSPPQVPGHDPRLASATRDPAYNQSHDQYSQPPQQRVRPFIDTEQSHLQRPAYMDHQPLSPANVPPRPSTAQGSKQVSAASPLTQQPQSAIPHDSYGYAPKPWTQPETHSRSESLGDIYAEYGAEEPEPKPLARAPTTRDEEIEAEMPDFDSAAPGQTSTLHKRVQTAENPVDNSRAPPLLKRTQTAPPVSAISQDPHRQPLPNSRSAQDVNYGQPSPQDYGRSHPGLRGPPKRGMIADGYGDASAPGYMQESQKGAPPRGQHPSQYHDGYQDPGALPPPQAPYASEPQVRRSLDDARQMPYRQGPPQPQRFYPNDQPPQGQYPPRNQQGWPGVGQERMGSAPPQSGMRQPPVMPSGPPDRNSNPDTLPRHPVPVRAGHTQGGQPQPSKPPPVRNYGGSVSSQDGPPHQRQPSGDQSSQPITNAELERLRAVVESTRSPKQELILVKKLIEASTVLANEGGRADPKTTSKNRERYIYEAFKRLKKIVAAGYPDAQFFMADCYGQGMLGLEVDTKEAFKLYQAAAKAGHPEASYRTAVCCEMGPEEGGGTSRDFPKAVQWYRRAAALGDSAAMYKLGAVLLKGLLGQQRNVLEAVTWLKRGAEKADKDHPHALHELAMLYESGNTNPEIRNKIIADDKAARELFQQAAGLGYKFSQFRLGQAYEYGHLGLAIDNRMSISWYTKAAAQGEHQAELALSGWYLTGAPSILEHSDKEAYLWARKAASSEPPLAKAMFAMGYFTENGIGCPASLDEARKWYGRAASYKFPKAVERLEELKKGGGKAGKGGKAGPGGGVPPMNAKLTRKDQKRDEENCVVM